MQKFRNFSQVSFVVSVIIKSRIASWLLLLVIMMPSRLQVLGQKTVLNPDEAVLMAWAKRSEQSLVPFKSVVTNTSGPNWALFQGLLHQLGLPSTILTAHFLSIIIAWATLVFILESCTPRLPRSQAVILLLIPTIVIASGGQFAEWGTDLLSLTTESLPLLLLSSAVFVYSRQGMSYGVTFLFGFAVAAKYQLTVISLVFIALLLLIDDKVCVRNIRAWLQLTKHLIVLLSPLTLLISWSLIGGTPIDNIKESLWAPFSYIGGGRQTEQIGLLDRLFTSFQTVFAEAPLLIGFFISICLILSIGRGSEKKKYNESLAILIALLASVIATMTLTFPIFSHYLQLPLYVGLLSVPLVIVTIWRNLAKPARLKHQTLLSLTLLSVFTFVALNWSNLNSELLKTPTRFAQIFDDDSAVISPQDSQQAQMLFRYCPRGTSVLVWGWAAELYSYYDWEPSSSFVETSMAMNSNFTSFNASNIIKKEIVQRKPQCIVEAIGPQFFGNYDQIRDSITQHIPDLSATLKQEYTTLLVASEGLPSVTVYRINPHGHR